MPSANTVAELQVKVSADTSDAEKGLSSLDQKVGSTGNTLATAFGGVAIAGLTALAAGFAASVTAAAGFEQQMSAISAVSGATATEMQQLSAMALELGKTTSFSASEAANGIEELIKAGVSIQDVMGGAASASLSLAAAGAISVGDAASIAANAMNQFNLTGGDLGHVADLIAGAANASAIDVNDFKFSLAAVGAVANTVGFSFDDTATAIALLGQAGIKGSDAGTSLKTMFLSLQPSTEKQTALFKELGLITADGANQFFDATGKVKGMAEIAGTLQEALSGMTQQQKLATLETIFGSDAIRAAAVFANEGSEGFNTMAASMSKVTAEAVAAERLNNLNGSFEQLKGSVETLAITFGMALLPALKSGTDGLTNAVNAMIPIAEQWGPRVAEALVELGQAFSETFGAIGDWFRENGPLIRQTLETFGTSNEELAQSFRESWANIKRQVGNDLADLGDVIRLAMQAINGDWEGALETLGRIDERAAEARLRKMEAHAALTEALFGDMARSITTTLEQWWTSLTDAASAGMTAISTAISTGWDAVSSAVSSILPTIQQAIMAVWDQLPADIQADLALIGNHIVSSGSEWVSSITTAGASMLSAIQASLNQSVAAVTTWAGSFLAPITGLVGTASSAATSVGDGILSAIQAKLNAVVSAVQSWAGSVSSAISGLAGSAGAAAAGIGQAIVNGISGAINAGVGAIRDAAYRAARAALDAAKSALGISSPSRVFAREVGRMIPAGVIEGVEAMTGPMQRAIAGMVQTPSLSPSYAGGSTFGGGGSAGMQTHRFVVAGPDGRTLAEWHVRGKEIAVELGLMPRGSS